MAKYKYQLQIVDYKNKTLKNVEEITASNQLDARQQAMKLYKIGQLMAESKSLRIVRK
jgi:hypothetical protein